MPLPLRPVRICRASGRPAVLGCGPQGIPDRIVVGPVVGRDAPDQAASEAQLGAPLDLADGLLHVIHGDQGDAGKAACIVAAKLGQPVIIGPKAGRPQLAVLNAVQHHAQAGVQHLAGHAVNVLVLDPLFGVPGAGPHTGVALVHLV